MFFFEAVPCMLRWSLCRVFVCVYLSLCVWLTWASHIRTGSKGSIGVFLWATDSATKARVTAREEEGPPLSAGKA